LKYKSASVGGSSSAPKIFSLIHFVTLNDVDDDDDLMALLPSCRRTWLTNPTTEVFSRSAQNTAITYSRHILERFYPLTHAHAHLHQQGALSKYI